MSTERSPLVTRITLEEPSLEARTPDSHRMQNYAVNNDDDDMVMLEVPRSPPRKTRTLTADSVSTVYDPFSTGNGPEDIQELLKNLEKATSLVKRHILLGEEDEQPRNRWVGSMDLRSFADSLYH